MGIFSKLHGRQPQPDAQQQDGQTINTKKPKHSGAKNHNQYIADPLAHFLAIPWAAKLLTDPAAFDIVVSDRRPLPSGDKQLVRTILNSETTGRACVTFCVKLPPKEKKEKKREEEESQEGVRPAQPFDGPNDHKPISKSAKLLQGGGPEDGEDPEKPFLLFNALLDLGEGLCSFPGMMHGGALAVMLDETMCSAANSQSHYAFTASMTMSFLKPVRLPGVLICRARVVRKQGRKIWVRGSVEDGDGNVMVESEAMLVDKTPGKWSKL